MYHFVRELERSRYPAIKGLSVEGFRGQLEYIRRHYNVIRMEQVIAAVQGNTDALPPRALLLTFDDGYSDHYLNVLPILDELGWQGSFFPPAKAVVEHRVLDVNKIHFVLASVWDPREIVQFIFAELDRNRERLGLEANGYYYEKLTGDSRYDTPDVTFIKRILQRELPEAFRAELTDQLFRQYVSADEAAFSAELYMNVDQLRYLVRTGMFVGSHGYDHYWLNTLMPAEQAREIELSLQFLAGIGVDITRWVMCYPYGGYDAGLLQILREHGCVLGLTTEVAIADLTQCDPLTLPRLDTNDLPKRGDVPLSDWTRSALK
jgi:peptidoglycan/xylan/chitin deacetylase (PgdA/CDA1 family)